MSFFVNGAVELDSTGWGKLLLVGSKRVYSIERDDVILDMRSQLQSSRLLNGEITDGSWQRHGSLASEKLTTGERL